MRWRRCEWFGSYQCSSEATNCSTWGGDSSGDPSYEVGDNSSTNWKTYLVVFCITHCEFK